MAPRRKTSDLELGWPRGEPDALNRLPEPEPAEAARIDAHMQALLAVSYDEWVAASSTHESSRG